MKIKHDFVTNSSSTAFVIIVNDEFKKDIFYNLVGIDEKSVLVGIFESLYYSFKSNMEEIVEGDIIISEFSQETQDIVSKAINENKKIFAGKLDSDSDLIEVFFCIESFVIHDKNIFIDASISGW